MGGKMIWNEPDAPTLVVHKSKPHDVFIGRPSKWGNPFSLTYNSRDEAIRKYEEWILTQPDLLAALSELKGKTLGCFCKPKNCHGDVLVKLVKLTSGINTLE